jgi:hypothetical protein
MASLFCVQVKVHPLCEKEAVTVTSAVGVYVAVTPDGGVPVLADQLTNEKLAFGMARIVVACPIITYPDVAVPLAPK